MNEKQFRRYLQRDGGCVHCGETETVAPHHRQNRGMGGSKVRDVPSNIVVLCSAMNNAVESNAVTAALAKQYGWKLESWMNPMDQPVYYAPAGVWACLTDDFKAVIVDKPKY